MWSVNIGVDRLGILYNNFLSPLEEIFSIYHLQANTYLKYLNRRIPTGYYTAKDTHSFLSLINDIKNFRINLLDTEIAYIDQYKQFLKPSNGISIPSSFSEIRIIETRGVFNLETYTGMQHK
ncbi:hypothetical protein COK31_11170 [Bacillus cereus]|nr:hypothetical protein COK31_11170 [Bacillus cereus]